MLFIEKRTTVPTESNRDLLRDRPGMVNPYTTENPIHYGGSRDRTADPLHVWQIAPQLTLNTPYFQLMTSTGLATRGTAVKGRCLNRYDQTGQDNSLTESTGLRTLVTV